MEDKQKTLNQIMEKMKKQIISLQTEKKSGRFVLSVELNLNQGGLGDTYYLTDSREKA